MGAGACSTARGGSDVRLTFPNVQVQKYFFHHFSTFSIYCNFKCFCLVRKRLTTGSFPVFTAQSSSFGSIMSPRDVSELPPHISAAAAAFQRVRTKICRMSESRKS